MDGEEPLWTDRDAVAAGCAEDFAHHRQPLGVHVDRVELADSGTVPQPKASPSAALAATENQCGASARLHAFVSRVMARDVRAARTSQPGHPFFLLACI